MSRCYYAAHNTYADLRRGNRGFANTWQISRFTSRAQRDAFVEKYREKFGRAVTRQEAIDLFTQSYLSVGKPVPKGGLFAKDGYGLSNFYNESGGG